MSDEYQGEDFAAYIERERERVKTRKADLEGERNFIDRQIAELYRESAAIDAYERAKTGKPAARTEPRQRRARRGDVTESVMNVIGTNGPSRRVDIINALGVKGDKQGEMSVSNALTRLKNQGLIARQDDGRWYLNEQALPQSLRAAE